MDFYQVDDQQVYIFYLFSQNFVEIKLLSVKIPKVSKFKTRNVSDFSGFIDKPNKNEKKDLLENKLRRPLIVINPIFSRELELNIENPPNSYNSANNDTINNQLNIPIQNPFNISEKFSIGLIE